MGLLRQADVDLRKGMHVPDACRRLGVIQQTYHCWMTDKVLGGWRYASVCDDARRVHPVMLPDNEVSAEEKHKYRNPVLAWVSPGSASGGARW